MPFLPAPCSGYFGSEHSRTRPQPSLIVSGPCPCCERRNDASFCDRQGRSVEGSVREDRGSLDQQPVVTGPASRPCLRPKAANKFGAGAGAKAQSGGTSVRTRKTLSFCSTGTLGAACERRPNI